MPVSFTNRDPLINFISFISQILTKKKTELKSFAQNLSTSSVEENRIHCIDWKVSSTCRFISIDIGAEQATRKGLKWARNKKFCGWQPETFIALLISNRFFTDFDILSL